MKRLLVIAFDPDLAHLQNATPEQVAEMRASAGQVAPTMTQSKGPWRSDSRRRPSAFSPVSILQTASSIPFYCVMVGAGIRMLPQHTLLFEMLVNVLHQECPDATFAFPFSRDNTVESALRVLDAP